ncbi:MAG: L-threonylcarbamoyladenylate synthase [Nitrospiria bacterium]
MPDVIAVDPVNPDLKVLSDLGGLIRKGAVIAFPTDTYYGLAANPFDQEAVARIFKIKGRPVSKPILLLIDGLDRLNDLALNVTPLAEAVITAFWPGPLTLVFEAVPGLPDFVTAGTGTIGIRLPDAALPVGLVRETGFAITGTSANPSGAPAPTTAAEVAASIGRDLDVVIDGGPGSPGPSTLIDVCGAKPILLREGRIPAERLKAFF